MFGKRRILIRLATIIGMTMAGQSNAQVIEMEGDAIRVEDTGMDLQTAQDTMDPLRLIEAYLVDKEGPRNARGGWGERGSNVYHAGQQIDAVIYLANVGKRRPGQPDNPQEMELGIRIRDMQGNVFYDVPNVHVFRGVRRLDTPLQDDYFRDRFTVSARVPEAGRYRVGFVFLDKTRPLEKQIPLEVPLDVVVEAETALPALTDLTEMMMAEEGRQNYFLRRCAAYTLAQLQVVGRDAFDEADFREREAQIRYFLNADAVIATAEGDQTFDEALDAAFAGMEAIADQYVARMVQNQEADAHPWARDPMLQRDGVSCRIVYDQRDVENERE